MKLYEFFGHLKYDTDAAEDLSSSKKKDDDGLADDVFWFILEDDELHKKMFLPIAKQIRNKHSEKKEISHDWRVWLPMVKKGCLEYWKNHKINQHPKDVFDKELLSDLCKRIVDHCHEDIIKGEYKID